MKAFLTIILPRRRMKRPCIALLCLPLLCLSWGPAGAATPAEQELYTAPMPHASLGSGGKMATVHMVGLQGYVEGAQGNAAWLFEMHAQVQDCVKDKQSAGVPAHPPTVWPEHGTSTRIDTYSSVNRTIQYTSELSYGVNHIDCSLLPTQRNTASLFSSKGTCHIDLREKTAHGACDANAQADAPAPLRRPAPTQAQMLQMESQAKHNPAVAAMLTAMRQHGSGGTGAHKVILGIDCEVWKNPFEPDGTVCLSLGGTFVAQAATGELTRSSMALEMTSPVGEKMHATVAKLDTQVNAAVFAPYLAGGFRIANTGAKK
ncbi:hypothetical protein ACFOLJ_27810 [Rugamonas sp. CCM 8940]|uniref:hypothetical protein n=1 Tax=Rugamonas sp. CCM 8940 TaxID=2765359 RepID=UPI0018F59DE5|nr:hypothetical protein [Rugamonas sp. CCM 8940]MBJ7311278.1 hypothetical protein [Rugamonas sp. CCM 8940]